VLREMEVQLKSAQVVQEEAAISNRNAIHEVQVKTEAHRSAKEKAALTKADHTWAEKSERGMLEQLQILKNKKMEVDGLWTSMQKFESSDGAEALDEGLLKYLADVGAESALLAAVPAAIQVPPSRRGKFDSRTWAEICKIIERDAATVDTEYASSVTAARYTSSEVLGLWVIRDVAHDRMLQTSVILNECKSVAEATEKALLAAETKVQQQQAALNAISSRQASDEKKVKELDVAIATVEKLRCPPLERAPEPASLPLSQGMEVDVVPSGIPMMT